MMSQYGALILSRISKMPRQRGSGNAKQFRRASLVTIRLLVNKMHMPSDRAGQREIDTVLTLAVII